MLCVCNVQSMSWSLLLAYSHSYRGASGLGGCTSPQPCAFVRLRSTFAPQHPRGFCRAPGHTAVATKPFHQRKERSLLLPQPSARGLHLDGGEDRQGLAQVLRADQHLAQADQVAAALAQPIGHQPAAFIAQGAGLRSEGVGVGAGLTIWLTGGAKQSPSQRNASLCREGL
jgi:hypothetical protein